MIGRLNKVMATIALLSVMLIPQPTVLAQDAAKTGAGDAAQAVQPDAAASAKPVEDAAKPTPAASDTSKLMLMITVFVLAVFVGFEIITKIPPTLHTPLMSGSNAISGITVIGALLATGAGEGGFATFLGFLAIVLATVNVVGGFFVTHRMLEMFRKKKSRNT